MANGGWTLLMMTDNNNGPTSTTTTTSLVPNNNGNNGSNSNNNQRLGDAAVQALARLSSQVHIRDNVNALAGNTNYVTSTANTVPIQNLRNLQILNFGVPANNATTQRSYWTQNSLNINIFDFTTAPTNTTWPSIYQATGNNAGFQFNGANASWQSDTTPTNPQEDSKRVYVK